MADLYTIDATGGKFTQKRFDKFCSYVKAEDEEISIVVDEDVNVSLFSNLRNFFGTQETAEFFSTHKDNICMISCKNAALVVDTNDIVWWQKQKGDAFTRLDKLFADIKINCANEPKPVKESKTKIAATTFKSAAGIMENAEINNLELFEGDKKSTTAFINDYYSKAQIRSKFDETKIVKFVINYNEEEELCTSTNWKTIDELELEGVVQVI